MRALALLLLLLLLAAPALAQHAPPQTPDLPPAEDCGCGPATTRGGPR